MSIIKSKKEKHNNLSETSESNNAVSEKATSESNKQELLEKPPEGQMYIKVYSPFKHYFDGLGTSISAGNDTGDFDILAGHHRFLTLLSACELQIRTTEGDADKIKIDRGIMYVKEDRVTVFLDV